MTARVRLTLAGLAVFLSAADTYVVVLALPDMLGGVGLGLDQLNRGAPIVTGFLLGYIVVLPLAGRVSDRVGRVPVITACLVGFAIGSLITASATDLTTMVAGRVVQGLGAGGLVPPTLALVADTWPPARRAVPLGVVGAAQEAGTVAGPLLAAAVLALADWRAIFWVNLGVAVMLVVGFYRGEAWRRPAARGLIAIAAAIGAGACLGLALLPPDALAQSVTWGAFVVPLVGDSGWTSPSALAAVGLTVVMASCAPPRIWRAARTSARGIDILGALLLAVALTGIVLTFAGAEVTRAPLDDRWPVLLGGSALAVVGFAVRQRHTDAPLIPAAAVRARAAWGGQVVNLFVGAALVAVLVNVPIFARVTRYPDSQTAAALVLVQFLAALPVGALAGGWLSHRVSPRAVAVVGLAMAAAGLAAMAQWDETALAGPGSSVALVTAGLGFGMAVAPINAVILAATDPEVHGLVSALAILARTMGMLVGLSALTAIGLRVFYQRQDDLGSPAALCGEAVTSCPAYVAATQASLLAEQQVIFAAAAGCAVVATAVAALLVAPPSELAPATTQQRSSQ